MWFTGYEGDVLWFEGVLEGLLEGVFVVFVFVVVEESTAKPIFPYCR